MLPKMFKIQNLYIVTAIIAVFGGIVSASSRSSLSSYSSSPSSLLFKHQQHENIRKFEEEMIAEETKRFYETIPYTTGLTTSSTSHDNNKISISSSTSSAAKPESISRSLSLEDLYKKSASEYWPQNIPISNSFSESYGNNYQSREYSMPSSSSSQQYGAPHPTSSNYLMTQFNQGYLKGKDINIMPEHKPIMLHYRTHAQPIVVHQTRLPGPKPEVKHTQSQEEPQRVVHEVIRPIIQEVHEIIQPYRRVVQQVQPVIEEVRTIIAKDAGKGAAAAAVSGGGSAGAVGSPLVVSGHQIRQQYGQVPATPYNTGMLKNTNVAYHASASNELMRPINQTSQKVFRKAALFENEEDNIMLPTRQNPPRMLRSRVFLTPKGIPVYQSNYRAPIYL